MRCEVGHNDEVKCPHCQCKHMVGIELYSGIDFLPLSPEDSLVNNGFATGIFNDTSDKALDERLREFYENVVLVDVCFDCGRKYTGTKIRIKSKGE